MTNDYQDMLQASSYEVRLQIESPTLLTATFPDRYCYPAQEAYTIKYEIDDKYPRYVIYHLIMGDMIRRCQHLNYNPALINIYKDDQLIDVEDFTQYISLDRKDVNKHNQLGVLMHSAHVGGMTREIEHQAKKCQLFDYLQLLLDMSGLQ